MRGGGFSSRWSEMSVSISCQNKSASTSCQANISCGYTHLLPEVSQGVIGSAQDRLGLWLHYIFWLHCK